MAEAFLSEIRMFSFVFAPRGWALCNGQLLPINQNQALFALLGTTYGGNGQTNFALPDLRDRVPMHPGNGHTLGEKAGQTSHTITMSEMPAHSHLVQVNGTGPNKPSPLNNYFSANTGFLPYGSPANIAMNAGLVSTVGGSQAHENMSPYLVISMCMCLSGVFPSQN
jgi:microcystin-dependent protein